jgi:hypothetical protein
MAINYGGIYFITLAPGQSARDSDRAILALDPCNLTYLRGLGQVRDHLSEVRLEFLY